jgi:hypothetical protein
VVILAALDVIGGAILLFNAFNPWAILLSMVIPVIILIYLFADRHVREAFNIG